MVERPPTKYRRHGFVSARDFIENAWIDNKMKYTFICTESGRTVSFELKKGPYHEYLIMQWSSEVNGVRDTEDVYVIAELWDGWKSKFKYHPYQVNLARDTNPCYLSQINQVTLDVEAFFGLSYCAVP
jgi:hypothetical protein